MTSRSKAVLIFSLSWLASSAALAAGSIRSIVFEGNLVLSTSELRRETLLRESAEVSDSLLMREIARIDSLYFSLGYLDVRVSADTLISEELVDVRLRIEEGLRARVGKIAVSGSEKIDGLNVLSMIRPSSGEYFDPVLLGKSLEAVLVRFNDAGYPYAQVWLTGFDYRSEDREVDLTVFASEGEKTKIGRITFEGISKTDSSLALRTARLRIGEEYRRSRVDRAREYLLSSGYFESVYPARLERGGAGICYIFFPLKEKSVNGSFQGAAGIFRKSSGDYAVSGAIAFSLRNIAGTGRDASFDWMSDGTGYSHVELKFREPFVLSSALSAAISVEQTVQDSAFAIQGMRFETGLCMGPWMSLVAGIALDRTVPEAGPLKRSVRNRFSLGFSRGKLSKASKSLVIEGVHRHRTFEGGEEKSDLQAIYSLDADTEIPVFGEDAVFIRLVSRGILSDGEITLAESYAMGGANSLRGYREAQFRGQKIAWINLEYRFGRDGVFFIFDDLGAYQSLGGFWSAKNGAGFGLRSYSPIGLVSLSFGIGERLSLDETRMHVTLVQNF